MHLFFWAPTVAASLHIFEEFVFPGGFLAWDRRYRPQYARSIGARFAVIANALLLVLCIQTGFLGARPEGVALWLAVTALLFTNALYHLRGAIAGRSYSPGVVTGVLLYIPLAVAGYYHLIHSGQATVRMAVLFFILGGSYPLISAALHRIRSKGQANKDVTN